MARRRSRVLPRKRETITVTRFRGSDGRFTSRRRGAKKETFIFRQDIRGRFTEAIEVLGTKKSVRVHVSANDLERRGKNQGKIREWLDTTNVFTKGRRAKIDITIRHGKRQEKSVKISLDTRHLGKRQRIDRLIVGSIMEKLSGQGLRTQYTLSKIDWQSTQRPRSFSSALTPMQNAEILIQVRR